MKKILLHSVTLLFSSSILAQQNAPKLYLGFGTGWNATTGLLGVKGACRVYKMVLVDAFAGLSSWGVKYGVGFVFNAKNTKAFCPAISIIRAGGVENFETSPVDKTSTFKAVNMDLKPATLLNLVVQRQWVFREKNKLVLEAGYSLLLSRG